jgi:uroporphyrinogen decarboxylase
MDAIIRAKECPERMGIYEHWWSDLQPYWESAEGLPVHADLVDYFDFDLRQVGGWCFNHQPLQWTDVSEDESTSVKTNGWGATLRYWKDKAGTPEHIGFELVNNEIWKKRYRERLLSLDPSRLPDLATLRDGLIKGRSDDRYTVFSHLFIFEIMRESMGDVVMLESMYLDPGWITDFCEVTTTFYLKHFEYLFREAGVPDALWIYEDMGFTKAPFISPELYRELIFPHHKRLVDFIHSYNIPLIMHSCGNIRPLLPHMAETGIDCLQVLEAKAGQHVAEFAEATGNRLAFMGNLNIVAFESNDRAVIDAEVLPKLDAVRRNRIPYVFHSDHSIPGTVNLDTYRYVRDLHRKYGRY